MKKTDERYDPLEVAKAEGWILAKGISSTYRKNKIVLFGYFMLGVLFVAQGGLLLWLAWHKENFLWGEFIGVLFGVGGLFGLGVGILIIKNIFIRRK